MLCGARRLSSNLNESDEFYLAATYVLSQNLVNGDALTMRTHDGQPITFAEIGDTLWARANSSGATSALTVLFKCLLFSQEGYLFAHLGKHEVFKPIKAYPPVTARELACSPLD